MKTQLSDFRPLPSDGLVMSRPFFGTWCDQPGVTLTYHSPADCRMDAHRIIVSVFAFHSVNESHARLVVGQGTGFRELATIRLPANAIPDQVADAVEKLKPMLVQHSPDVEPDPESETCRLLIEAGMRYDDFWFQTAWIKPSGHEFVDAFVRGAPEARFAESFKGEMTVVMHDDPVDPYHPVEVGYCHTEDGTMTSVVAPDLRSGLELLEHGILQLPGIAGQHEVFAYADLVPSSGFRVA